MCMMVHPMIDSLLPSALRPSPSQYAHELFRNVHRNVPLDRDGSAACCKAMVVSVHAHARVLSVDPAPALALAGVAGYYDHRDLASRAVKGKERVEDDKDRVFAEGLVTCVGMAIGIVVAESAALARRAALLVQVEYAVLPPCLTMGQAVAQGRFHEYDHCVAQGDVEAALEAAPHRLSGGLRVGAQEHFYMEPHALMAVPGETFGEMTIVSCTQVR
jgi:xanthine dehydrogenase molybdopterin-binding subunit B